MEKKQGFFSALREEVVRGLSPGKSRSRSRSRSESPARSISPMVGLLLPRRRKSHRSGHSLSNLPEPLIGRSGSFRPAGEALAPLIEGPDPYAADDFPGASGDSRKEGWGQWVRGQLSRAPSVSAGGCGSGYRRSDLRLLLGVMGAPLVPIHVNSLEPFPHLCIKDTPIVSFPCSDPSTRRTGRLKRTC